MTPTSRYRYCIGFRNEEVLRLTEREPVRFSKEKDNRFHTVVEGDTLWGIAHRYFQGFNRPELLWWILAEFQEEPILDPTIVLTIGSTVVVPSERYMRTIIFTEEQRRYH